MRYLMFNLLVLVFFSGVPTLFAQNVPSEQDDVTARVKFCLKGIRAHCKSLKSGLATYQGSLNVEIRGEPEKNLSGPVSGVFAFEGAKERFDVTRPGWTVDSGTIEHTSDDQTKGNATAQMKKGVLTKQFSDDGSKCAIWQSFQPVVSIGKSGSFTDRRVTEQIDYRCPTLFENYAVNAGYTLDQILDQLNPDHSPSVYSVETESETVWKLIWVYTDTEHNELTRWILWVDVQKDFIPTKFLCESTRLQEGKQTSGWIAEWENTTTWKEVSDVWVPVHVERKLFMGPYSGANQVFSADLKWQSVNKPIPAKVFTYAGFEVPDHIAIQDTSSGEAVWIKSMPAIQPQPEPPHSQKTIPKPILIGLNLLIILLAGVWYLRKRLAHA
ncbi:hypothetical protein Pan153_19390 [Gimesia panareensis]|uniref:Uncharacterized protein n=1 Tax=Gimesia panareensis TaxID=2527978 RepID=A0A518FLS6_9PLAN|nr:hypothetical protein Pan153_19390 [Gimesia panareensis]